MTKGERRRPTRAVMLTGGVLALAAVIAAAWWARASENRRLRDALDTARRDVAEGRFNSAREPLADLASRRPDWDEVPYLQGLCEQARGRTDAALAAWSRVPESSAFAAPVAVRRARVEMSRGRLSEAERVLSAAVKQPGPGGDEARRTLALLLRLQGRLDEVARITRAGLGEADGAAKADAAAVVEVLRSLWALEHDPYPVAAVRGYLDEVGREAPDDDRVWLGRARLALRAGRLDDAARWLDACDRRRPDDPAVARARLDHARAAGRPDLARVAAARVAVAGDPASQTAARAEALALDAWLARLRGDADAERRLLETRRPSAPADLPALARLAELAAARGRADEATTLRRLSAEIDRTRARYADALGSDDPAARAAELCALAKQLGLGFESRWWARLAGTPSPPAPVGPPARTLADLWRVEDSAPVATTSAPEPIVVRLDDDATAAGLAFRFDPGRSPQRQLPETMSGGVGLLDYDGDGRLDVYCVQGGTFPPPAGEPAGDRLFRNRGDGTFEDVTERSGLSKLVRGYGHGVAVGDVDNDGQPDVFLTRWRAYTLLRNRGDGTFEDATARYGLDGDRDWPTSAAFADLDNDGDLDLYVCHYLAWDADHPRACTRVETGVNYYCTPGDFPALADHVFRNDGGRFTDVSESAGVSAADRNGRGLGVAAADLDGDGLTDIYVANDMSANFLFHNLGGFRFEDVAHASGAATGGEGGNLAGMGIACGDLDGDGRPDLVVTNFFGECSTLHHNLGGGQFADHTAATGLGPPTRDLLGFGVAMFDADVDGFPDLLTANGHVNDGRPQFPWSMPVQLLLGGPGGRLRDAGDSAGPALAVPHLGRGLAAGDLDDDGRVDAVVVAQDEPLVYLHNRTDVASRHRVTFILEGTRSNRDGVGARVTVRAGGRVWVTERCGGGSYLSAGDPRLHFGLGPASKVDAVEVRWPSGQVDRASGLAADAVYRLREGEPAPARVGGNDRRP